MALTPYGAVYGLTTPKIVEHTTEKVHKPSDSQRRISLGKMAAGMYAYCPVDRDLDTCEQEFEAYLLHVAATEGYDQKAGYDKALEHSKRIAQMAKKKHEVAEGKISDYSAQVKKLKLQVEKEKRDVLQFADEMKIYKQAVKEQAAKLKLQVGNEERQRHETTNVVKQLIAAIGLNRHYNIEL